MAGPPPPYITRDPTERDEDRYQTVYARAEGSVAAPTAGLHYAGILDSLSAKGVLIAGLDLQVWAGHLQAGGSGRPRRAPDASRALRDQPAGSPRWSKWWGAGRQHLGRRYDGRRGALESAVDERGMVRAGAGETS